MRRLKEAGMTPVIEVAINMNEYLIQHDIRGIHEKDIVKALEETMEKRRDVDLGTFSIAPEEVGPMSPMFASIELKVSVSAKHQDGIEELFSALVLNYSYKHTGGGSNGITRVLRSDDNFETYDISS